MIEVVIATTNNFKYPGINNSTRYTASITRNCTLIPSIICNSNRSFTLKLLFKRHISTWS